MTFVAGGTDASPGDAQPGQPGSPAHNHRRSTRNIVRLPAKFKDSVTIPGSNEHVRISYGILAFCMNHQICNGFLLGLFLKIAMMNALIILIINRRALL